MRTDSTPRAGCCYRSRRKEGIIPLMVRHDLCKPRQTQVDPLQRREKERRIHPLCAQHISNHVCEEDDLELAKKALAMNNCDVDQGFGEGSSSDPDWSPSTEVPRNLTRPLSLHLPKKFRKISTSSTFHSIEEEHLQEHHIRQEERAYCEMKHNGMMDFDVEASQTTHRHTEPRVLFTLPSDDDDESNQ